MACFITKVKMVINYKAVFLSLVISCLMLFMIHLGWSEYNGLFNLETGHSINQTSVTESRMFNDDIIDDDEASPDPPYNKYMKNTDGIKDIYILSAFWDDRWSNFVKPSVSVIGAIEVFSDEPMQLVCLWHCSDEDQTVVHQSLVDMKHLASIYYHFRMYKGKHFDRYVINCDIQEKATTCRHIDLISLVFSDDLPPKNLGLNNSVKVEYPAKKRIGDFVVCVPLLYGYLNPVKLIEWLELQRILGVSKVVVYDAELNRTTRDLLDRYKKIKNRTSYFEVRDYENNLVDHQGHLEKYTSCELCITIPLALADCMYRNMHQFNYTIFIDVDESITPARHKTLTDMMNAIRTNVTTSHLKQYNFQNFNFLIDNSLGNDTGDPSKANHTTYIRYRTRVGPSGLGFHAKSIINPLGCVIPHNHFCHHAIHDYKLGSPNHGDLAVPAKLGRNLHYRHNACSIVNNKTECRDGVRENYAFKDDNMLLFEEELTKNVPFILKELSIV